MALVHTLFYCLSTLVILAMGLFGLQSLVLALLFLWHRRDAVPPRPPDPAVWPIVTVQLPLYNERFMVERLIDAACALDYPRAALHIQVLDDSTDETTLLARRRVALQRRQGVDIHLLHRGNRSGYKAGALAVGLEQARGELIAVFDADFLPQPDFLREVVPYLAADPGLGMAQARWGHLNDGHNLMTRAQAISLDGHFVVIQTARSRSGLLFNFNGTAGIWRKSIIEAAGGWSGDTLAEDLDLSYRAQIQGWRMLYLPSVNVPSEIPPQVGAYKIQQSRWARGGIQVLHKLNGELWRNQLSLAQKVGGTLHLSSYLSHPMLLFFLLFCLPVVLLLDIELPALKWLSAAGLGPPLLVLLSQRETYPDWKRRTLMFPVLICLSIGITLNNTLAVLAALRGGSGEFARTPKFSLRAPQDGWRGEVYDLRLDWTVWGELALAGYCAVCALLAAQVYHQLAPWLALTALGFGFVGAVGWLEGRARRAPKDQPALTPGPRASTAPGRRSK